MKTDLVIAQEAVMEPIARVAERIGIPEDALELYGRYKAKISDEYLESLEGQPEGKLILVTAINPTPARRLPVSDWGRHLAGWGKRRWLRCGSLPWVPVSASREERQEAVMPRWFPWRN